MYYLAYGALYLLSLLPLRALYLLSDFAWLIVYKISGYRKKIVMQNPAIAFPEMTGKEEEAIASRFYRNFTDTFIETIKLISAGENFLRKHFITDGQLFHDLHRRGLKCQAHLGHNFNWELANVAMPLSLPYEMLTVYMPIRNKTIDRLFKKIRGRTGVHLLPATQISTAIRPYRDWQYVLALVADQNPGVPSKAYWVEFFGRPTPFVKGPEKGARTNNTAIVFVHFTKKKRGYYETHFELATDDPRSLPEKEVTRRYIHYLERVVRANPDMWLWTHRRWKHEWKPEYGEVIK